MLALTLALLRTAAVVTAVPSCTNITSVSLTTAWGADSGGAAEAADLHYVTISATKDGSAPFALETCAEPSVTIHDLLPGTTYYLRWRSHPSDQTQKGRNVGWDWGIFTTAFACTTAAVEPHVPSELRREGELRETEISVSWLPPAAVATEGAAPPQHVVGVRQHGTAAEFTWVPASTAAAGDSSSARLSAVIKYLKPGGTHEVVAAVRLSSGDVLGAGVPMRTAAAGVRYCKLQYKCRIFQSFLLEMQKEWRIAPEKR